MVSVLFSDEKQDFSKCPIDISDGTGFLKFYGSKILCEVRQCRTTLQRRLLDRCPALDHFHFAIQTQSICEKILFLTGGIEIADNQEHSRRSLAAQGQSQPDKFPRFKL